MKFLYQPRSVVFAALLLVLAAAFAAKPGMPHLPKPFATPSATKFPVVIGWPAKGTPHAPEGFRVELFAEVESPRWIYVLSNDDVLVAQSKTLPDPKRKPEEIAAMKKARMMGRSPNQILLMRDANGDGTFEMSKVLLGRLRQPFGMAVVADALYVANTDSILQYPFDVGADQIKARAKKIADLPAGGYNNHWTRALVASPNGRKLYVTVGSQTNVDEEGRDAKEPRRAAILEMNTDGGGERILASGMRNPNGMDWDPETGRLWVVVNERDETGDDLVPDYLTRVQEGGFYGWPYAYFGQHEDPRHKGKRPDLVAKAIVPDVALGAHTASLGLVFYRGTAFPERYRNGAFIGQHGSWNRSKFSGYRVAFQPFKDGEPNGPVEDFLTGFIAAEDRKEVYGRPVGLAMLRDGSLLVADDAGNKIWRVRPAR